jgi:hypothetical protein
MDAVMFEMIAREVFLLMDQQMKTLIDWSINGTSKDERAAYEARRRRIQTLRSELEILRNTR